MIFLSSNFLEIIVKMRDIVMLGFEFLLGFDLKNSIQLMFHGVCNLKNPLFGLNWNFAPNQGFTLNRYFCRNWTQLESELKVGLEVPWGELRNSKLSLQNRHCCFLSWTRGSVILGRESGLALHNIQRKCTHGMRLLC